MSTNEGINLSPASLFSGDTGRLPEDARRVLVQLLSGPSLDRKRHSKLWAALLQHQDSLHSRLAELFLQLVVDSDLEVAFVRQADTGELEAPILLRRTPLTFLQSVLLLYLRQLLAEAEASGQRAVVSRPEMADHLKLYEQSANVDKAGFDKRVNSAIEKVKENSIISQIRGSEERYEISPTLKLMFSAEQIAALTRRYIELRDPDVREHL